jgi:hypothetical protein
MTKKLRQRCGSGWDSSQNDFYAVGFDALVKRWDKQINVCREMNVFPRLEYHMYYVLCQFVTYLLTFRRICVKWKLILRQRYDRAHSISSSKILSAVTWHFLIVRVLHPVMYGETSLPHPGRPHTRTAHRVAGRVHSNEPRSDRCRVLPWQICYRVRETFVHDPETRWVWRTQVTGILNESVKRVAELQGSRHHALSLYTEYWYTRCAREISTGSCARGVSRFPLKVQKRSTYITVLLLSKNLVQGRVPHAVCADSWRNNIQIWVTPCRYAAHLTWHVTKHKI